MYIEISLVGCEALLIQTSLVSLSSSFVEIERVETGATYGDALPDLGAGADVANWVCGASSNACCKARSSNNIANFASYWNLLLARSFDGASRDQRHGCESKDTKDGGLHSDRREGQKLQEEWDSMLGVSSRCEYLDVMLKLLKISSEGN